MPATIATRHFRASEGRNRSSAPARAAGEAQGGLVLSQALTVLVISLALVMFAFGENALGHFISMA